MSKDLDSILRSPKAYDWARKAIEAMESNRVWPTTLNFELWLHYVAAKDGDVATEIDSVLSSGQHFTEQVAEQIAEKHLPHAKLSGEILDAGKSLTQELESVTRALESARESSEAYGQQLASASASLEHDENSDAVRAMVETLSVATAKVRDENKTLESQLADTNDELSRLKQHLEQARREAMTDSLTMLANRKAFDETFESACAHAVATGEPLALAILDIDHFKKFNDTWGHQTGDQVIRFVASVIGRAANEGRRFSARYGGEEFALIFPGETSRSAMGILETVREEISSRILKRRSTNEDLGAITISIGVADHLGNEHTTSLLDRADGALYASKNGGRNRTSIAPANEQTRAA
ncbi:diguanylate cyclase [Phenylobacterium sp.]|uniref:GGDEF domain-containing protein n=1 Tax=Phenylobacterium sp. TaxID=1871053 RepID=UPI003D29ECF4